MKMFRLIAALATPLLLTGCLLSPGKFASTLDLQRDGTFAFTYTGEIVVTDTASPPAEFAASPCYDETTSEERECKTAELDQQRKDFAAAQSANQAEAGAMTQGMGDFGSEESIAELIGELKKQDGWKSVTYRGNRIIDVEYAISGTLSHGFSFPLMDGGAAVMPFVTMTRRKDGSVKITAPAFSNGGVGGEMAGLGALAGAAGTPGKASQPKPEGTFTITTDGRILTNNTEDGPVMSAGKSVLTWLVNSRLDKGPEALIGLAGQ
ncbi:hypothetical protein [Blastomonas aquatica]|uniref:Lipoprotein n=1 Tax=Blastomonas aquatica TaxID=1510276 RepID=A0ABQ1JHL5_9SPHN|nr:hypothetical protein [Blastomonas aquatica]GGB67426.1 hypothetical protein GCM10010833_23300 [Blastomonas aquatica]